MVRETSTIASDFEVHLDLLTNRASLCQKLLLVCLIGNVRSLEPVANRAGMIEYDKG